MFAVKGVICALGAEVSGWFVAAMVASFPVWSYEFSSVAYSLTSLTDAPLVRAYFA